MATPRVVFSGWVSTIPPAISLWRYMATWLENASRSNDPRSFARLRRAAATAALPIRSRVVFSDQRCHATAAKIGAARKDRRILRITESHGTELRHEAPIVFPDFCSEFRSRKHED